MKLPEDTTRDIALLYEYDLFIASRTLYMGSCGTNWDGNDSGVDFVMAERMVKGLHILDRMAPKPPGNGDITILMNNPGGDWYHGAAIYDAIKGCENHVTIRVLGHAMSMGALILQAADERVLAPNARVMIHYGDAGSGGHAKNLMRWAREYERLNEKMEDILLERIREKQPKFAKARIKELLKFDTIFSAEEAVELGLADRVA
jgi:ATP-dependent Clp endopeptidase proteolytic subunit ClpP